jgi:ABC-2 type transport system permease protein
MNSIANIKAIWKRELKGNFYTPMAWVFIGIFTLVMWVMFNAFVALYDQYTRASIMGNAQNITLDRLSEAFFANMHVILLFILPFFTMRIFTEESRQNTLALLMTSPLRVIDITLSKFLGAATVLAIMLGMTFIFPVFLFIYSKDGRPDLWVLASTYAGLYAAGLIYISFGIFFSSITESQLVAVVLSFALNFSLWLVSLAAQSASGIAKEVFQYASVNDHFQTFAKGAPELKSLVYFVSMIVFGMFLTHRSVASRSWRS